MRLGAHVSIAGGVDRAIERAARQGFEALQIFTRSNQQWAARPLRDGEVRAFVRGRRDAGIGPAIAHASYLINLASPDEQLWRRSIRSFRVELERCALLELDGLVVHPGSHCGSGPEAGLARIAAAIEQVVGGGVPPILLETTAGQGTQLGRTLGELAWLCRRFNAADVAVCVDTCHVHAAGAALDSAAAATRLLDRIDRTVGRERLAALHLNDSVHGAGSRRDRHAGITEGTIAPAAFGALMRARRLAALPGILETPKGPDGSLDGVNIERLHQLARTVGGHREHPR